MLEAVLAAVLLPFLAAPLAPHAYRLLGERVGYLAAAVSATSLGLVTYLYLAGADGVHSLQWIALQPPGYTIELSFLVDGFSLLMGFIASGMGVLIMVYSRGYMHGEPRQGAFYAYMLAFMGSMLGVVFAEDLVALFVFWELTSLTSFALIGFYTHDQASVYGARKSLVITVAGGLFMLVGFLALHEIAGTFSITALFDASIETHDLYLPALVLVVAGAAAKSAQFPLHIWLPNAMEAPTPVSAFLHSATMVKAGVYLLGRLSPVLGGTNEWVVLVGSLGLLTMLAGAVLAVASTDVKELLAYSTVSHLGLITAAFGFAGAVGASAGVLHIVNHMSFKAALFMVAGIAAHAVGTRSLNEMGGLARRMPWVAGFSLVAVLSMAGVPPFNGFYSKEILFEATVEASSHFSLGWVFPLLAVTASVFTFVYSIRFYSEVFLGETPKTETHSYTLMAAPVAVLVGLMGLLSVWPDSIALVARAAGAVAGGPVDFHPHLPTKLSPAFVMSLTALAVGGLVYLRVDAVQAGLSDWFRRAPPLTADYYYDAGLDAADRLSGLSIPRVDTGYLRTYVGVILVSTVAVVFMGYLWGGPAFRPLGSTGYTTSVPLVAVLALTVTAALAVPFARSHIEGVLLLSIVGFMVGIFYVIVAAPDLAMTQIVVETITLVVFLIVLERLPVFYVESRPSLERGRDLLLAGLVGATVFVSVLAARSGAPDKIAPILVERSVPEGGGHNVVNVILVDFRAFDTLGEITVVAIAAVGVLTLIAMREVDES